MNDEKTIDQLWAEHDALASNPVVQARFAQAHRLHDRPRPTARPDQPTDDRDGAARFGAMRASNLTAEQVATALAWTKK